MKLLVTGVEGYIGCLLAPFLQARGHEIVGLDTGYYRDGWLFSDSQLVPGFPRTINRDIRNIQADDLQGIDAVVHMAELSNDPLGENVPELTFQINHQASVRLAELAKAAGVKLEAELMTAIDDILAPVTQLDPALATSPQRSTFN